MRSFAKTRQNCVYEATCVKTSMGGWSCPCYEYELKPSISADKVLALIEAANKLAKTCTMDFGFYEARDEILAELEGAKS